MLVEYASMFDMHHLITLEDRIILLKKLHTLFGTHYIHDVNELKYRWKEFKVSTCYSRKLKCTEDEIIKEFKNLWPIMNRIWPQYHDNEDKLTIHIKFLNHLSNHTITHSNVLELI